MTLWVIFVRSARSRRSRDVRFAPKADMRELASICPLRAKSGLMHRDSPVWVATSLPTKSIGCVIVSQTRIEQFETRFEKSVASAFSFASIFKLGDRTVAERRIAREIVRVEDRTHVAQRVPGDGGDLGLGGLRQRQPRDGGSAQVVERDSGDPGLVAGDAPTGPGAPRC